jgi:hypothetical protein
MAIFLEILRALLKRRKASRKVTETAFLRELLLIIVVFLLLLLTKIIFLVKLEL